MQTEKENIDPNNAERCDSIEKVLKERAEHLKINLNKDTGTRERTEVLEFFLGAESYIIESGFITQVIALRELTPLPCTPEFIQGIINVNGRILVVIDLKDLLNLPKLEKSKHSNIILLKYQDIELGILADHIAENTYLYAEKFLSKISSHKGIKSDFILGVTKDRQILLDTIKILTNDILIINDEV